MTELLDQNIANLIASVSKFTADKAPVVAEEVLRLGVVSSVLGGIFFLILCAFFGFIAYCVATHDCEECGSKHDKEEGRIFGVFLSSILIILFFTLFVASVFKYIKIKIAPNTYVLEKVMEKVKND